MNSPPEASAAALGGERPQGAVRLASLGSGSSGNGTLVRFADACFLVDCGFGLKEAWARLVRRGLTPEDLTSLLVTHEH